MRYHGAFESLIEVRLLFLRGECLLFALTAADLFFPCARPLGTFKQVFPPPFLCARAIFLTKFRKISPRAGVSFFPWPSPPPERQVLLRGPVCRFFSQTIFAPPSPSSRCLRALPEKIGPGASPCPRGHRVSSLLIAAQPTRWGLFFSKSGSPGGPGLLFPAVSFHSPPFAGATTSYSLSGAGSLVLCGPWLF